MKNLLACALVSTFLCVNIFAQELGTLSSNKALTASVTPPPVDQTGLEEMATVPAALAEEETLAAVQQPEESEAPVLPAPVVSQEKVSAPAPQIEQQKVEVSTQPATAAVTKVSEEPVQPAAETEVEQKVDIGPVKSLVQPEGAEAGQELTLMPVEGQAMSSEPVAVQEATAGILPSEKEEPAVLVEQKPAIPTGVAQTPVSKTTTKEQRCADTDTLECMPKGLNTVDVDAGGNWVVKRAYWEQTEKTYEKIMKLNNELHEYHMNFVRARNESDKMTDQAFRELGFQQGQLSELLDKLVEEVRVQQEQQGDLTEQERAFLQELKTKKNDLELMKKNLQIIDDLDDALDKVMETVGTQIGVCRNYEQKTWDIFKAVGKELNDKKAREMFYTAEGFFKTVEQNRDYMVGSLKEYFEKTIGNIKKRLDELKASVDQLKAKGTDLTSELNRFIEQAKKKELSAQEVQALQQAEEQNREQEARKGWVGWSFGLIKDATRTVRSWTMRAWHAVTDVTQTVLTHVRGWSGKKASGAPTPVTSTSAAQVPAEPTPVIPAAMLSLRPAVPAMPLMPGAKP